MTKKKRRKAAAAAVMKMLYDNSYIISACMRSVQPLTNKMLDEVIKLSYEFSRSSRRNQITLSDVKSAMHALNIEHKYFNPNYDSIIDIASTASSKNTEILAPSSLLAVKPSIKTSLEGSKWLLSVTVPRPASVLGDVLYEKNGNLINSCISSLPETLRESGKSMIEKITNLWQQSSINSNNEDELCRRLRISSPIIFKAISPVLGLYFTNVAKVGMDEVFRRIGRKLIKALIKLEAEISYWLPGLISDALSDKENWEFVETEILPYLKRGEERAARNLADHVMDIRRRIGPISAADRIESDYRNLKRIKI
jgi:hypothetical protein